MAGSVGSARTDPLSPPPSRASGQVLRRYRWRACTGVSEHHAEDGSRLWSRNRQPSGHVAALCTAPRRLRAWIDARDDLLCCRCSTMPCMHCMQASSVTPRPQTLTRRRRHPQTHRCMHQHRRAAEHGATAATALLVYVPASMRGGSRPTWGKHAVPAPRRGTSNSTPSSHQRSMASRASSLL
jgi:hypothetical protein